MKKSKKRAGARVPEIVSLNDELFSLVSGDQVRRARPAPGARRGDRLGSFYLRHLLRAAATPGHAPRSPAAPSRSNPLRSCERAHVRILGRKTARQAGSRPADRRQPGAGDRRDLDGRRHRPGGAAARPAFRLSGTAGDDRRGARRRGRRYGRSSSYPDFLDWQSAEPKLRGAGRLAALEPHPSSAGRVHPDRRRRGHRGILPALRRQAGPRAPPRARGLPPRSRARGRPQPSGSGGSGSAATLASSAERSSSTARRPRSSACSPRRSLWTSPS